MRPSDLSPNPSPKEGGEQTSPFPFREGGQGDRSLEDRWILSRLTRTIMQTRASLDRYEFNQAAKGLYDFVWHDFCDWYLEMAKVRLYGSDPAAKAQAQDVLLYVLTDILKLLHPFIPFITEEIWQRLPKKETESVMIAQYPKARPEWIDEQAEQTMQKLQALITAIRTIRSEMNVPPQKRAQVFIKAEAPHVQQLVHDYKVFFDELAQASE